MAGIVLNRLTSSDVEDAPTETTYIPSIIAAVNKLVDSSQANDGNAQVPPLKSGGFELSQLTVQMPDQWASGINVQFSPVVGLFAFQSFLSKNHIGLVEWRFSLTMPSAPGVGVGKMTAPFWPLHDVYTTSREGYFVHIDPSGNIDTGAPVNANVTGSIIYTADDQTPLVPSQGTSTSTANTPNSIFPMFIKTNMKSVGGIWAVKVDDAGTAADKSTKANGFAYSVDFDPSLTVKSGQKMIKINNIAGLPYNRKSIVTLVAISGE